MAFLGVPPRFLAPFLISLVLPLSSAGLALGDVLVQYTFPTPTSDPSQRTGPGFAATTVDDFAMATDVSLSDQLPVPGENFIDDRSPMYGRPVLRIDPGGSSTTADQAVANARYFEFTLAADDGFLLDLDNLMFGAARGGSGTPRGWVVRSNVDGFASNIATADITTVRADLKLYTVDLSSPAYLDLTEITFRIYSYAPAAGNSVEYVDVTVNGFSHL
jgi:hypothetical protein